jgi:hypothetical protein
MDKIVRPKQVIYWPKFVTKRYLALINIQGPFEKLVDWRQCAVVMQREAVTVMPSCSGGGGGNIVVARSSSL